MEKMKFTTKINASREKVWKILWNDDTYRKWTSVFSEGSHAKSDWNEGSKVHFLDGKGQGMVSMIAAKKPNEFMSFKHLGTLINGVEDLDSPETKKWSGALENYTLSENNGITELTVEIDVSSNDFLDYFKETFPKAMDKVKTLSENHITHN